MALVTLFIRGGHAGDAGVEVDCTCGCDDVCSPDPITPTEDVTPFDDLTTEPVAPEDCAVDVPETTDPVDYVCASNADCAGDVAGSECHEGECFCPNAVVCTEDADCAGDIESAYCHGDGVCMVPCAELP